MDTHPGSPPPQRAEHHDQAQHQHRHCQQAHTVDRVGVEHPPRRVHRPPPARSTDSATTSASARNTAERTERPTPEDVTRRRPPYLANSRTGTTTSNIAYR